MPNPLVHIVILNWNNSPDTADCLRSLEQSTCCGAVQVVVDNGSTDGSIAEISGQFPDARILKLPENRGFAGGVNAAAQQAVREGAEYIFLLNNDASVRPDTIAQLVSCAEDNLKTGIIGAKILRADDPGLVESEGVRIRLRTGRISQIGFGKRDSEGLTRPVDRDAVHGAAMLVRTKLYEEIGPMAEEFFCYFEEIDYCLRAREAGWRVIHCPAAKVLHKGASTFGGTWSAKRIYYAARNHLLLVARHSGALFLPIRLWWVRMLMRAFIRRAPAEKRKSLKRWLKQAWTDYDNEKFGKADYEFTEE